MRAAIHRVITFAHTHLIVVFVVVFMAVGAALPTWVALSLNHDRCAASQRNWDAIDALTQPAHMTPTIDRALGLTDREGLVANAALSVRNNSFSVQRAKLLTGNRPVC